MNAPERSRPDPGRRIRVAFFLVTAALIGFGVVMIYSASSIYADQRFGDGFFFLKKHLAFLVLGSLLALGAMPNPMTHQTEVNLDAARETIDVLVAIKDKTVNNLSPEENQMLTGLLAELQVKYSQSV